jgi:lipid-binding SYLF domain-containing protein
MRGAKGWFVGAAIVMALGWWALGLSGAAGRAQQTDEEMRAAEAALVLGEIMEAPDQGIPEGLLDDAYGIAVIPHVVKGAFGFGGRYGKGLIAQRHAGGGWGNPLFVEIGGGSFGFQIGVEATDVVMVFTNSDGLAALLGSGLKIGADATATAGPVGRKAEVGTDILLNSAIYSYSRSKGLFAGVALDGAVLQLDDDANNRVYGETSVAADLARGQGSPGNNIVVRPFLLSLEKYAPGRGPVAPPDK